MNSKQKTMSPKPGSVRSVLEIMVLTTSVAGLLYFGYFLLAPWIWSQNLPFSHDKITSWILPWLEERDGVELYALYILMFLNLFFVFALSHWWGRFAGRPIRYLLALPLFAVLCVFIRSIGFNPPMNTLADRTVPGIFGRSLTVMGATVPTIILLYYLQKRSVRWLLAITALVLIPVCFIATAPISWLDYPYILAPALRLLHGATVSEIYFQYDLLLSLIGAAWMKLRLDLNQFQIVAQCSFFLLLFGIFAFSRQWFLDKRLPVLLLATLVLVRIYAGPYDAGFIFQVTPFRLDMWLILVMLVYFQGPHHWSSGLYCGLMLLFHKNFGIIYSAAYIQLLITLCAINTVMIPGKVVKTVITAMSDFCKKNYPNMALILVGALAHYLLFRNTNVQSDFYYQRLGIGFIKIATNSFYWYVVVMSGLSFVLLLKLRSRVSDNYLATGFCLMYLSIGNSLYFFGRSHENAIINISAILLLQFFLLLDLVDHFLGTEHDKPAKPFIHRNLVTIVAIAFIGAMTIWYGDSIIRKVSIQMSNVSKGQLILPSRIPEQYVLNVITDVKTVTGNNPKVYFVDEMDFLLNYYGSYAPVGYYNPMRAWISKRQFNTFLQGLVDQGYYLVVASAFVEEVLPSVTFGNYKIVGSRLIVWK
jgi:hypothetical protein